VGAGDPAAQVRDQIGRMMAVSAGLTGRRLGGSGERHAAALRAVLRTLDELAGLAAHGFPAPDRAALAGELERTQLRRGEPEHGRVVALDLRRARTRRFSAVFVLGWRRAACPAVLARTRSSTPTRPTSSASTASTRSSATATCSTRP